MIDMEIIGSIAAVLTTGSFLPQVIHTLRIKDTKSISLTMYLMIVVGTLGWLVYGLSLNSKPLIIANGITFGLSSIIFAMKLRNVLSGREREVVKEAA